MLGDFGDHALQTLANIERDGLHKRERMIVSPQGARIQVRAAGVREMLNLCANNYLGLANHADVRAAARRAIDTHGFGMASVRFICGTQQIHDDLENTIAAYLGKEAAITFAACFDANGGLFETLMGAEGRDHLGQPQPCLDHRWRAVVEGEALPLRELGHD